MKLTSWFAAAIALAAATPAAAQFLSKPTRREALCERSF